MSVDDLEPGLEASEREALLGVGERLRTERPVPAAGFRGTLRRRLEAMTAGESRPRRLWLLVFGYATSGALLLALVALGVAGSGPFAA